MQKPIMKKSIFIVAAMLTTSMAFAQQNKEKLPPPPPPPAPPVVDTKPVPPPPPPPPPVATDLPDDYKAFLKRNPTVKGIGWSQNNAVRIRLKSGKEEVYDLNKEEEALKLKNKYGDLPVPPPPPPKLQPKNRSHS